MKAKYYLAALATLFASGGSAEINTSIDACRKAVAEHTKGEIVKIELEDDKMPPYYEFDVKSSDGVKWELKCDQTSAKILETKQKLGRVDHPLFTAARKIDETQARKIALEAHPGTVSKVEYDIEDNGAAIYEFNIQTTDGRKLEVEIDAVTGKIVKVEQD